MQTLSTADGIEQLAQRSQDAIKNLIKAAEYVRMHNPKSINFVDSFFKEAAKHIL